MHIPTRSLFLTFLCLLFLSTACADSSSVTPGNKASNSKRLTAIGSFIEYPLPRKGNGLMRPAIDSKGRLWFGEMSHNVLTMFDPHTQTFVETSPPRGAYSIMGITVAHDDTIWFAEQDANYIGHYVPTTKRFETYSLPTLHIPDPTNAKNILALPSAPNDIALDAHGNLWFAEMNADSLGMLNTHTGALKQYPLSHTQTVQTRSPYGITVDTLGMVWFTEATTRNIGRLDPSTGVIRRFTVANQSAQLMEIASDTYGIVWVTSFSGNLLLRLDPLTGIITSYTAPSATQGSNGLYGLVVTSNNDIWVTIPAENAVARFDTTTLRFVYHTIPSPGSFPFGLVTDTQQNIWFTEAGSDNVGMLAIH